MTPSGPGRRQRPWLPPVCRNRSTPAPVPEGSRQVRPPGPPGRSPAVDRTRRLQGCETGGARREPDPRQPPPGAGQAYVPVPAIRTCGASQPEAAHQPIHPWHRSSAGNKPPRVLRKSPTLPCVSSGRLLDDQELLLSWTGPLAGPRTARRKHGDTGRNYRLTCRYAERLTGIEPMTYALRGG